MTLTACPQCNQNGEIWIEPYALVVDFKTGKVRPYTSKVEAWCAGPCKQLYWWYHKTGRITRRTVGQQEW